MMMENTSENVGRRSYLKTTGLATAVMVGLAGCTGDGELAGENGGTDDDDDDGESETGLLSTSVTDQPNDIGDFESLIVTIDGIWIKPANTDDADDADEESESDEAANESEEETNDTSADDDSGEDDEEGDEDDGTDNDSDENGDVGEDDVDEGRGRRYIEFDEPQEADLVQLQGDNSQLIDETEVDVGTYQFLQLNVSNTEGILAEDGSHADVETPGNAPLQFKHEFDIRADERTRFIADFAPQRRGRRASYIIRPVATGTTVLYGDEEYTADDGDDGEENNDEMGSDDEADSSTNETQDGDDSSESPDN